MATPANATTAGTTHPLLTTNSSDVDLKSLQTPFEKRPEPLWRVWTCIETLLTEHGDDDNNNNNNSKDDTGPQSSSSNQDNRQTKKKRHNPMMQEPYRTTTIQVASVLQTWALKWAGQPTWKSVLHKRQVLHEVEESIVALHYLHQWLQTTTTQKTTSTTKPLIAVDVCGGKGLFSLLLSFVVSDVWSTDGRLPVIQKIVLLEKATGVNWDYIAQANERTRRDSTVTVPLIEIWSNTNLHDYDTLLTRFQTLCQTDSSDGPIPLVMSGIHLCKMLSPSLMNLCNGLGPVCCPYLCVAPCCLPRMATSSSDLSCRTIPIQLYETTEERRQRLDHNRRKLAARRGRVCYLCLTKQHWVRQCPELHKKTEHEQEDILARAAAHTPCWNCGLLGHLKPACPTPDQRMQTKLPPTLAMDLSEIYQTGAQKYEKYCQLLATTLEASSSQVIQDPVTQKGRTGGFRARVIESGLDTRESHQEGNWDDRRKSIFIVATR